MEIRSFVVSLPDGKFAYEQAFNFWHDRGALVFMGAKGNTSAYAPGEWRKVSEVKPEAPTKAEK